MNSFVHSYPFPGSGQLRKATVFGHHGNILSIGQAGSMGLIMATDPSGNLYWAKTITYFNQTCTLRDLAHCSNGDFLIMGTVVEPGKPLKYCLIRIKADGSIVWQKEMRHTGIKHPISITSIGLEEYVVAGWKSGDDLVYIKVNGNGVVLEENCYDSGGDDQIYQCCLYDQELIGVGFRSRKGVLIKADLSLKLSHGTIFSFPHFTQFHQVEAITYIGDKEFIIAGNKQPDIFIARITYEGTTLEVRQMAMLSIGNAGHHSRIIKIVSYNDYNFILGYKIQTKERFLIKINKKLQFLEWVKFFDFDEQCFIMDITPGGNNDLILSGLLRDGNQGDTPLIIRADLDLSSCKTKDYPINSHTESTSWELGSISWGEKSLTIESATTTATGNTVNTVPNQLCEPVVPISAFQPTASYWLQSPYLYLQAAGSLGDDSAEGVHLRWHLMRNLGENHLPKADYAGTTHNFNKADDFIRLYKLEYSPSPYSWKFSNFYPHKRFDEEGLWVFKFEPYPICFIYFKDPVRYQQAASLLDPSDASTNVDFWETYGDRLIEVEFKEELVFALKLIAVVTQASSFKVEVEAFSVMGDLFDEEERITARKAFTSSDLNNMTIQGENIRRVRLRVYGGYLGILQMETYQRHLDTGIENNSWAYVDSFALTKEVDNAAAFQRLEEASRFDIHNHWWKFKDSTRVNVSNYQDRWTKGGGLKFGVEQYIGLSDQLSNPKGTAVLPYDYPSGVDPLDPETAQKPDIEVQYLDLILLAASDYHVARMLGLGYIDTPAAGSSDRCLYLIEYHTHARLDDGDSIRPVQHLFMSVPTGPADERLPKAPEIDHIDYGLIINQGTLTPVSITDAGGYTQDGLIRFVNIYAKPTVDYHQYDDFFNPSMLFQSLDHTDPMFGDLEYRKQGMANWVSPSINHEQNYLDTDGDQATLPIIWNQNPEQAFFIHRETEEGIHEYALRSINIFSRPSLLSNPKATDYTSFDKSILLLPPSEFRAQLIQPEGPLITTTQAEQDAYQALAGDKTLVRVTFNYHHVHDDNYAFADEVELYFRQELPIKIQGAVRDNGAGFPYIIQNSGDPKATIFTADLELHSIGETIVPIVPPGQKERFIGGYFIVEGHRYRITDIQYYGFGDNSLGEYPGITVEREIDRSMQQVGSQSIMTLTYLDLVAVAGNPFVIVENTEVPVSWASPNPLPSKVQIGNNQWQEKDDNYTNSDGQLISRKLRGIWETATVTEETVDLANKTARLKIAFDSFVLQQHPQSVATNPVDWHQGIIRVASTLRPDGEKKMLKVLEIENVGGSSNTVLRVLDEDYQSDIPLASPITINFYPGYRIYLHYEDAYQFNEAFLLPADEEAEKRSLLAARSVDTATANASNIGHAAILLAAKIVEPKKPNPPQPLGPKYATPPDVYFKSTYTFSVEFTHKPYATIFYRADLNAILRAIYDKDVILSMLTDLGVDRLEQDLFFVNRMQDIFTFIDSGSTPAPTATFGGFDGKQLRNPNKAGVFDKMAPSDPDTPPPGAMINKLREEIYAAFVPLSKDPILFEDIEPNELIKPELPAKVLEQVGSNYTVQFTDYTLDGSMNNCYFYCAREMGNRQNLGPFSLIDGPIKLINTAPPQAPVVRKVVSQVAKPLEGIQTAVKFELEYFPGYEKIRKIHIYRTNQAVRASSIRTMQRVKVIEVDETFSLSPEMPPPSLPIEITDDFTYNIDYHEEIPYGDTLYYRLIGLREITYKDVSLTDQIDFVPSESSKVFESAVVDIKNPAAPILTVSIDSYDSEKMYGVRVSWSKSCYKGKYTLFKMNSSGNWRRQTPLVSSNNPSELFHEYAELLKKDEDGDLIFHRFKVSVENTAGLLNLVDKPFTISRVMMGE